MRLTPLALPFALFLTFAAQARSPSTGLIGTWSEPGGSVIAIAPCGADVCARLVSISKAAPATTDIHNPNPTLRSRPLCGLTIGTGFHLADPTSGTSGKLYDPRTGKTYKGSMNSQGNTLQLRGYVGIKAFGRTATWTRDTAPPQPCH